MKKVISALFVMLILCSCSANQLSFTPKTEFSYDSVIDVGDFSYKATIKYIDGIVYITPTTTNAKGMTISCNGECVMFSQGSFFDSIAVSNSSINNPARVLYDVLSSLDSSSKSIASKTCTYSGKTLSGKFVLVQDASGEYKSVSLADSGLNITFNN